MDVFCKIAKRELPANVVYEDDLVMVIMDATPFMPGHALIIPKNHYETVLDMDERIIGHVHETAKKLIPLMEKNFPGLESVKIVVNYGEEQKVKHYHMHLIPLYKDGKVPDETQEKMCELLKQ